MSGHWDRKLKTFKAPNDVGNGITMKATYMLTSKDSFEFCFVAKDDAGKIYFHPEGMGKREQGSK